MGDFGAQLNHSLNRIGCFVLEHGLNAADCEAIFNAGMAARVQFMGAFVPLQNPDKLCLRDLRPDLFADQQRAA